MQSSRLPPSLLSLLTTQLRPHPSVLGTNAAGVAPAFFAVPRKRAYATNAGDDKSKEAAKSKSALQMRMADKAARMKTTAGTPMVVMPVIANYVRPAKWSQRFPENATFRDYTKYLQADGKAFLGDQAALWQLRKLGKPWRSEFMERATEAYKQVNSAIANGPDADFDKIATAQLIAAIKSQRVNNFKGLNLSWKLHRIVKQEMVCVRHQEVQNDEAWAQIAVRFVTDQSLEVRNSKGTLLKGNHDVPERVTEYYAFQRAMWLPKEDWKIMQKVQEIDPYNLPPGMDIGIE
ncbi:hypothetical protein MNV49_000659 [Pseudohyphozyma bogoriensis]|nr:hypothetical protein MNV49_000659 [Pseudohyphozyma bogoriensis]